MLKFLMKSNSNITIKDQRGDTVRDHIYRYMSKDQKMINTYNKYESRMLIDKMYSNDGIK